MNDLSKALSSLSPTLHLGQLHLMPVPLNMDGEVLFTQTHGSDALKVLHDTSYFVVENAKTARRMLATLGLKSPISALNIVEIPKTLQQTHGNQNINNNQVFKGLLKPIFEGFDIVLLSEAGCPAVADPGSLLVKIAYECGIRVVPHVGPSSLLLALMASGMNGQSFAFVGYVPQHAIERQERLLSLEKRSALESQTQIIIETPYRNVALIDSLLNTCKPTTLLGIAIDLTCINSFNQTHTIAHWNQLKHQGLLPLLHKRQMVVTLLA